MKIEHSIFKAFLIVLLILIQCTSKEDNSQTQMVQHDYSKINSESEEIAKSVTLVFECNFFGSRKPGFLGSIIWTRDF